MRSSRSTDLCAVITQCEIRKLYARNKEPSASEAIEVAKNYERRRCGHHPDQYPEPLSTLECLSSVVDPKQSGQNKHRYVVASQSQEVRRALRGVRAVPLIYIKRSVMILEPMADDSAQVRAREEKAKFRAEIRSNLGKRKRTDGAAGDSSDDEQDEGSKSAAAAKAGDEQKKKKKYGGPKEPNPLSVKKSKKKTGDAAKAAPKETKSEETSQEQPAKRKRRNRGRGGKGKREDGDDAGEAAGGGSDEE